MDTLDLLNARQCCGLCDRPIRYTDDFCSRCRRVFPSGRPEADVVLDAELLTAAAVA
jgi:predicted amidophosphoribosyltransferase